MSVLVAPVVRSRPIVRPRLGLALIWRLLPIAFAFSYAASIPIMHSDLFYTLANGRLMVERGQFPLQGDPFTYATAVPGAYDQPWLAQVAFLLASQLAGLAGVSLLHALAIASAMGVLVWLCGAPVVRAGREGGLLRAGGASPALAGGLGLLGLVLAGTNFNIRPQSLAFLPFAVSLALVRTTGPGQRWAIPAMGLVAAIWANVHGSFTLAVLIAAAHAAGTAIEDWLRGGGLARLARPRGVAGITPGAVGGLGLRRRPALPRPRVPALLRHRLGLAIAAAVGTCLNPAGPGVWAYALSIGDNPIVRQNIQEWWPTTAMATVTAQLFFATLPPLVAALVFRRRHLRAEDVLLLVGLGALAVTTQRAVTWWGLAAPVVLASACGGPRRSTVRELPLVNALLLTALAGIMLLSLPTFRAVNPLLAAELRSGPGGGFLSADHPIGAVDYLAHVEPVAGSGRVFARMEWGGYLAWSLWPRMQVFLDARIERHPPEVWQDYFAILAGRADWESLLDRQGGADYLLLERAAFPELVRQVDTSPRWRRVYQDDLSVLYARAA